MDSPWGKLLRDHIWMPAGIFQTVVATFMAPEAAVPPKVPSRLPALGPWKNPVFVEEYDQIDLSVGYDFNNHLCVSKRSI